MIKNYRPEIDGLRAIAVISVIFYHADISIFGYHFFNGGFIGVDVFFVISGYLITSIIINEISITNNFSFKYFYERRIRRIIPVFLFIIFVSFPVAWLLFLPNNFIDFSKSILFSLGFISNFYFWLSGNRYGAESETLKPFLHTWSLSVEEQFYIFFPVILIFIYKYFRNYITYILIAGIIISLLLAQWGSKSFLSASFYLFPTRVWEIMFGSLLAYFEFKSNHRSRNKVFNKFLPSVGLLLILYSFINYHDRMYHPSLYTLPPIIGVCILIWFSNKNELVTKILSSKLFVGTGLISYSLYLWHYPIFAFARTQYDGKLYNSFLLILITIILSIFTYFLIEKPFRNKKYKFKKIFYLILFFYTFVAFCCFVVLKNDGFKNRFHPIFQTQTETKILRSEENFSQCVNIECTFNKSSKNKIYMIGDSIMLTLINDLKDKVVNKDFQFISSIRLGCLYFPGFNLIDKFTKIIDTKCHDRYFSDLSQKLENEKGSIVIIGGRFPLYLNNKNFDNEEGGGNNLEWEKLYQSNNQLQTIDSSFKASISKISTNNKIILIYPFPEAGWNVPKKFFNFIPKKKEALENFLIPNNYLTTSYEVFNERTKSSFKLLDSIQGDNIYRVYPHKLFCNTVIKERCLTHDNKNIFYTDDVHPSPKASELINNLIIKEIIKIN